MLRHNYLEQFYEQKRIELLSIPITYYKASLDIPEDMNSLDKSVPRGNLFEAIAKGAGEEVWND